MAAITDLGATVQGYIGLARQSLPGVVETVQSNLGLTLRRLDELRQVAILSARGDATAVDVVAWNAVARDLVAKNKTPPPKASRIYAILSQVQHQVLSEASKTPGARSNRALAAASSQVLTAFFPAEAQSIQSFAKKDEPTKSRGLLSAGGPSSEAFGIEIADAMLARRANDGADRPWNGHVPDTKPGVWRSTSNPPAPPALPNWGEVTPWFIPELGNSERPLTPKPPRFGTKRFEKALAEVRRISDTRTPEQLAIAMFWADNAGTATPPGHWNEIACKALLEDKKSAAEVARILAAMNAAMMDAGIACWETKYEYWLCRPSHADPGIVVPEALGLPNFPAYVSGHASFSGAAAQVLGHFLPDRKESFAKMADEAAWSRVLGGIHYDFDGTEGVALGRKCADFALRALG